MEDKKIACGNAGHAGEVIENVLNEATSPPPLYPEYRCSWGGCLMDRREIKFSDPLGFFTWMSQMQ
jgi:hypothetical protein